MLVSFFVGENGIILLNHLEEVPDFSLLTINLDSSTFEYFSIKLLMLILSEYSIISSG